MEDLLVEKSKRLASAETNPECNSCTSNKCFIYRYCSKESINILELNKRVLNYKKGQYIFYEGDPVQGLYIIRTGKAKVLSTGYNKRTQIIRLSKTGQLLGHRGLGDKYYLISAAAIDDSVICFVETNVFTQILKNDSELTYELMLLFVNELRISESRMKNLAQMTVREKSAEALLLLKQSFGIRKKDGIVLDAILTRKDMADLAGLSTEQITKCFSEFRQEKIIQIDGKRITILKPENLFKLIAPYYPQ